MPLFEAITNSIQAIDSSGTGYIKYDDGTMICYGNDNGSQTPTAYYNYYQITKDVSFPQTFISAPIVANSSNGFGYLSSQIYNITTTRFTFSELKLDTNSDYNINYIAINYISNTNYFTRMFNIPRS